MTWWDDEEEAPTWSGPSAEPDPTLPPRYEPTAVWMPPEPTSGGGVGGPPTTPGWGGGGYGAWPPPPPGGPSRPRRRSQGSALGAVIAATVLALGAGAILAYASSGNSNPFSSSNPTSSTAARSVSQAKLDPSAIANQEDPAIVDVTSTLADQSGEAAGTGMILTSGGEILTNNHVIEGSSSITVKISNRDQTYPATVVGTDVVDDVALLQAHGASGLPTVNLGNSSTLTVGDGVVAIGNALNKPGPPTVTEGSITGLNRSISVSSELGESEQLSDLVETNAQLEPGNSGGPLFDASGHVIGMNTAAATGNIPAGRYQRRVRHPRERRAHDRPPDREWPREPATSASARKASSASTSRTAAGWQRQRWRRGAASAAASGAGPQFGNGDQNGNGGSGSGSGSGVTIAGVQSGSPADQAGLSQGDQIISVDGQTVSSSTQLTQLIATKHPGDTARITWIDTSGDQQSATVRLATRPSAA